MRLRKDAYTLAAIVDAGIPAEVARTLLADGPAAVPMRPRLALTGRRRGPETREYVWGPDANVLLEERRLEASIARGRAARERAK